MKPIVVYHAHCTDGFGAAFAFWRKHKDEMEYWPANYTNDVMPDFNGRDVYLVDFSYKRAVVAEIIKVATKVTLVDHHATALSDLEGLEGLSMANSSLQNSGAMLAWDFVHGYAAAPWFFKYIEDRDLWKFKHPQTKIVLTYLDLLNRDFEAWNYFCIKDLNFHTAIQVGGLLLASRERSIDGIIDKCGRTIDLVGFTVPLVNITNGLASEVGNKLSKTNPFSVSYFDTADKRVFSLRSSAENLGHVDVSKIAMLYGGGGHKHAAGFHVERTHSLAMI